MNVIRGRSPSEKRPDRPFSGVVSQPFSAAADLPAAVAERGVAAAQQARQHPPSPRRSRASAQARAVGRRKGVKNLTARQEEICRLISQEIQRTKRKCENPTQENYIYWCGYRDGLDKAYSLAQYAKGTDGGDPLLVPMLELGVHNTRYRAK